MYIVEQKLKSGTEPLLIERNAAKIANLTSELSKALENEKTLRSQNAEMIRSKAIIESQSNDLLRKLEAANQCIADYELKMAKLTAKNTELQSQCTKIRLELDEMMRSAKEKSESEKFGRIPKYPPKLSDLDILTDNLDSSLGELTLAKIKHYEVDIIKKEKTLSMEKEQLRSEKRQLKNDIADLTSKFEKYQKKQDDYVRKLDSECSSQIASILSEKRSLERKLTGMAKEMRYINDVLKRNKIEKSDSERDNWVSRIGDHGRHHQSSYVNLKTTAARYHRKSRNDWMTAIRIPISCQIDKNEQKRLPTEAFQFKYSFVVDNFNDEINATKMSFAHN